MKRDGRFDLLILLAVLLGGPHSAYAQPGSRNVDLYLTLATDSLERGQSQTDGAGSAQFGIDYQHVSGFFVGGSIANVEYAVEIMRPQPRQIELDVYLGFGRRGESWSWALTAARYKSPDTSVNYDYSEIGGTISYRNRLFYSLSYTNDFLSQRLSAANHELSGAIPLVWKMELGMMLGRFNSDDVIGDGYTHWNVGLSKPMRRFALDLRFYDTRYSRVSHLGQPADKQWVFSLSYVIGAE